jgi:hypothetical protein
MNYCEICGIETKEDNICPACEIAVNESIADLTEPLENMPTLEEYLATN